MQQTHPIKRIFAIFTKDILSELRTRYAISAIFLFVLTTITIVMFGMAQETLNSSLSAGILWIIMFFSSMVGMSKSFVTEEERGTGFLLQLSTGPLQIYFGKLLFNILLCLTLNLIVVLLFVLLLNTVPIKYPVIFSLTIFLGSIGIAGATTIISAIIAKANTKNALFPVLSFPLILPLILIGIETTTISFDGTMIDDAISNLQLMVAYSGIVITVSYLLFGIVWND